MVKHRTAPPHGTRARYYSRDYRCRCEQCTAANTAYQAKLRRGPMAKRPVQLRLPTHLIAPFGYTGDDDAEGGEG